MIRTLRVPAVLAVVVLGGCGSHTATKGDGKLADAKPCAIDGPTIDANGCVVPCGTIATGSPLCNGMEICLDPCGDCPPGCAPLV